MDYSLVFALLGKLHPAVVHFPIACVVFVACLELFRFVQGKASHPASLALLLVGSLGGVFAGAIGYANRTDQEFYGAAFDLVEEHQLFSLISIAFVLLATFSFLRAKRGQERYIGIGRVAILLAFSFTLYGAHHGALLVHGNDYFTEVFSRSDSVKASLGLPPQFSDEELNKMPKAVSNGSVTFASHIEPLFEKSCNRCHANGKKKGGLKMDSRALLLEGGESGPAVQVGNSRESYMIHLVSGLEHDKFMPEKGKKLTAKEIGLLRTWIDEGLKWDEGESSEKKDAPQADSALETSLALRLVRPPTCKDCREHPIDRFLSSYFKKNKIKPPKLVSSERYVRRLYLDLVGRLPRPGEVSSGVALLEESSSSEELVSELLSHDGEYAGAWLSYWNDLLRNDYTGPGFNQKNPKRKRKEITGWLKRSLEKNMPYDLMVKQLISPNQRSEGFIRGILWPGNVNPNERPEMQAAQNVGQVFLGINLKCASCHDSFTSEWTLEDSYSLASVFAKKPLPIFECDQATGELAHARFLFSEVDEVESSAPSKERLQQLAASLTSPDNGRFARTLVNRFWAKLLGRGFVEPLDEAEGANWNPELHEWLSVQFVQSGFDLKELLRLIVTSDAYRMVGVPGDGGEFDANIPFSFRGPLYRPMSAEAVLDSLHALLRVGGPLSTSDLKRIQAGERKSTSLRIPLTELRFLELEAGDYVMTARIPVRKKRKETDFPESLMRVSSKGLGRSLIESYRFDDQEGDFLKEKSATSLELDGAGQLHLSFPKGVTLRFEQQKNAPLEVVFHKDIFLRSSLREHNEILASFGRPKRVQVVSRRDSLFSSPRALKLLTSSHWDSLVRASAAQLKAADQPLEMVSALLGRKLNAKERALYTKGVLEAPADVMWSVLSSPDLLIIQ